MTASAELAEDLTQEVFLRAFRSATGDPGLNERAWLFRTARNILLNFKRDEGRQPFQVPEAEGPALVGDPDAVIDLGIALLSLDEEERDIFLMRELGGLGYEDIATIFHVTQDSIRSRIYRARMALREALTEEVRRIPRRASKEART